MTPIMICQSINIQRHWNSIITKYDRGRAVLRRPKCIYFWKSWVRLFWTSAIEPIILHLWSSLKDCSLMNGSNLSKWLDLRMPHNTYLVMQYTTMLLRIVFLYSFLHSSRFCGFFDAPLFLIHSSSDSDHYISTNACLSYFNFVSSINSA